MRITEVRPNGPATLSPERDGRITLRVPMKVWQRCAHKRIVGPGGATDTNATAPLQLTPFQLALVRGHRWLAILESGEALSMKDLAQREGVDPSLVSRLVNMTTLAPELVEAILDNRVSPYVTLLDVAIDPPLEWRCHRSWSPSATT